MTDQKKSSDEVINELIERGRKQQRLPPHEPVKDQNDAPSFAAEATQAEKELTIGIMWCTFSGRRSWPQLADAYRPPTLFASKMRNGGHSVQFLMCDEELRISDLNGARRILQDTVNLFYIMTHGEFDSGGYEALLAEQNWTPGATGLAQGRSELAVAVFDTCNLIDTANIRNWQAVWAKGKLGPSLRLLLGFDGLGVIGRGEAGRGRAFAMKLLDGMTFADAWIQAVHENNPHNSQYVNAVAIAIGDSLQDAELVLNTASLSRILLPRKGPDIFFGIKQQWKKP